MALHVTCCHHVLTVSGFGVIQFGTKIILFLYKKNSIAIERAEWLSGYMVN